MNEMTKVEAAAADLAMPPQTEVQARIDAMLSNRSYIVERVKPLLINEIDIYQFEGMKKPSLGKAGAEKLAQVFGFRAAFRVDEDTVRMMGEMPGGKKYVAYVCDLTDKSGASVGQGRGAAFVEFERNSYRTVFSPHEANVAGAKGPFKAKNGSSFWKVPEPPVFDPLALNKAIKMSQKSAFVDAVIRATGMSDLFTQDVEDMDPGQRAASLARESRSMPAKAEQPNEPQPEPQEATVTVKAEASEAEPFVEMKCERPGCGGSMRLRNGKMGQFYGCTNYNQGCRNTKPV